MNRLFRILFTAITGTLLLVGSQTKAAEVTVTPSQISDAVISSATYEGLTFTASKSNGANVPIINATYGDMRVYAKGTFNIQSVESKITQVVFTLSTQGMRRLAPITPSVGSIATQQAGDATVTWSGNAYDVTFTVGDKADYGSDGSSKAGQLCFDQIVITTEEEESGTITHFTLTTAVSPVAAGTVFPTGSNHVAEGATISCSTTANTSNEYYKFQRWVTDDGTEVSTSRSFVFTMPNHDVTLTAVYEYDPQNPADPNMPKPKYTVKLSTIPVNAGTFNWNTTTEVEAGTNCDIYTYYNTSFWFREWQLNGETVSTSRNYQFQMPEKDIELVAVYDYNPSNPSNPNKNFWNESTGEVIIDDFSAGSLSSAISTVIGSNNSEKVNLITVSGITNQYDWGILNNYLNCNFLDLSRTTGLSYVPSYNFSGNKSIQSIILPASIESISNYAFQNCSQLSTMDIYAVTPPTIGYNAFTGCENLVVHVPAEALSYYQDATGWKNFTILPLGTEVSALEVNMPEGTDITLYKDMSIELVNTKSGQKMRYVITNRTTYTFNSLIHRTNYNVYLKNAKGSVLGEINNLDIIDKDVSVTFEALLTPRNLSLTVETPDGNDVTDEVTVTWMDDKGNYLARGNALERQLEGTKVMYRITLPQSLAMEYLMPADAEYEVQANNNINCTLSAIPQTTISGKVVDVKSGNPLSGATVSVSQMLNGLYSVAYTTKTDANGAWSLTVCQAKTDITASMTDYVSQTQSYETPVAEVSTFELKDISGTTILLNLAYTNTEGETQNFYSDYANVIYSVFNQTTGQQITDLNVQYPQIVLMESLPEGTELKVVAESKMGKFVPVEATSAVDNRNMANVTLSIVQLGGICATFRQTDNNKIVGVLYNNNGHLIKKYDYTSSTLAISELKDGEYTLVTMGHSQLFNSVAAISQFADAGLKEGTDYVKNKLTVRSGEIAAINNQVIPYFDETKLYYTGSNTSFTVNKAEVTAGQYLTLCGKIDFKPAYENAVDNVCLVVDIPEGSSFVENSVMYGSNLISYTISNNTLTIPLENYSDRVRFCVIPTSNGVNIASASISFDYKKKRITQPIGAAAYLTKGLSIVVPQKVASTKVTVSGVAPRKSTISVYDSGVLVGRTNSTAATSWNCLIELNKPYDYSYHTIYATIVDETGNHYQSESRTIEYSKQSVEVSNIKMIYQGYEINFDMRNGVNSSSYYSYVPGVGSFTFVADFTENDTILVKNVRFKVLASDRTTRTIPAFFDTNKNAWVATSEYPNSSRIPVNVKVEFDNPYIPELYNSERESEMEAKEEQVLKELEDLLSNSDFSFSPTEDDNTLLSATFRDSQLNDNLKISALNYDETVRLYEINNNYISYKSEDIDYCLKDTINDGLYKLIVWDNKEQIAFAIEIANKQQAAQGKKRILPILLGVGASWIMSGIEHYCNTKPLDIWRQAVVELRERYKKNEEILRKALNAKCSDGQFKLRNSIYRDLTKMQIDAWSLGASVMLTDFELMIYEEDTESFYRMMRNGLISTLTAGLGSMTGKLLPELANVSNKSWPLFWNSLKTFLKTPSTYASLAHEGAWEYFSNKVGEELDKFNTPKESISSWYATNTRRITDEFSDIYNSIVNNYSKCESDDDDDDDEWRNDDLKPGIDPSGYVYEGVSSNRVQGATASVYYKETVEDMYGDLHENVALWNAEEYAQQNPLFTDENGMYRWDVPQGLWQVKFEKEGYETTYSEWLPVPPPQLDVNIAMRQFLQPTVKNVNAYADGIEMEFDKYMDPETLTPDNILVTKNGDAVNGTIKLLNEEVAYEGKTQTYASKVRFEVPEDEKLLTTDEVQLTVRRAVKSYAGTPMENDYTQQFDVELQVQSVVVDSLINVAYGGERTIMVAALPADAAKGKTINVKSLSSMIAKADVETLTLDENGQAELTVTGELPGATAMSFVVDGTDVKGLMTINVKDAANLVAIAPRASRVSGTEVYRGTQIRLTSETENATIYYTLDGSCPCDLTSESVIKYNPDEPIIIADDNVTIKAMAQGHDLAESDVAEFTYFLKKSTLGYQMPTGWSWISHNLEEPVPTTSFQTNAERIVSQKAEQIYDPALGFVGNLNELQPVETYKVKVSAPTENRLNGYEFNAVTNGIGIATGWNWLGYPLNQTMSLAEAFAFFTPTEGDYIVGQDGFAEFADSEWHGTLEGMVPGKGYMYKSETDTEILFNTTIVSEAGSKLGKRNLLGNSPWSYDKNAYQNIMPVIAEIYNDGDIIDDGEYVLGAFSGTECRGIGQWTDGKLMLSVYGEGNESIRFIAVDQINENYYDIQETLTFEPDNKGTWHAPMKLTIGRVTTDISQLYGELFVSPIVFRDHLSISVGGRYISRFTLTNMLGVNAMDISNIGTAGTITTTGLADGVYVLMVQAEGNTYYKKIMKASK